MASLLTRSPWWSVLALTAAPMLACSSTSESNGGDGDDDDDTCVTDCDGEDGGSSGGRKPVDRTPHALATITIVESGVEGSSNISGSVSATFLPDVINGAGCGSMIDGCEFTATSQCDCPDGSICTIDTDTCEASCKELPECEETCGSDEICVGEGEDSECVAREEFGAGVVTVDGVGASIEMEPPYPAAVLPNPKFRAGTSIEVKASGADDAGFEPFEESIESVERLEADFDGLTSDALAGGDALPVRWQAAGSSTVVRITLTGPGGYAVCEANDADGEHSVSRAVVEAVLGSKEANDELPANRDLQVSIARENAKLVKTLSTRGELSRSTVRDVGWLDLRVSSIQSTTVVGCREPYAACDDSCVDLQNDNDNCGSCGKSCSGSSVCGGGRCQSPNQACDSCVEEASENACASEAQACADNSACRGLHNCVAGCAEEHCNGGTCEGEFNECMQSCAQQHQAGIEIYNTRQECFGQACPVCTQ